MFRIIDFHNSGGKLRITIETDDQDVPLFLRLFTHTQKFAELFDYRLKTESGYHRLQLTKPQKMEQASQQWAAQLEVYRGLKGDINHRLRVLKEMRASKGEDVTLDMISAQLTLARQEERVSREAVITKLAREGRSIREISAQTNIPVGTVARILKGASKPPQTVPSSREDAG